MRQGDVGWAGCGVRWWEAGKQEGSEIISNVFCDEMAFQSSGEPRLPDPYFSLNNSPTIAKRVTTLSFLRLPESVRFVDKIAISLSAFFQDIPW